VWFYYLCVVWGAQLQQQQACGYGPMSSFLSFPRYTMIVNKPNLVSSRE
jgi:hypothetical protein